MGNTSGKHQSATNRPKKNVHWKTAEIPSAPGKPVLVHSDDADSDVVTLKWERPRTDGGSPLYGYYVEHRRTGSAQWVNSTPALILYPEVVLAGLEPGWRYQFRVTAENAVGTSDYSELSEQLTVALQRNAAATAPRYVSELPDTTTVIENEKVEFRVAVAGQPVPVVNWFKDGFEVFSSRRTKIVTEAGCSTLIIHQTALTDEGEIKCTATNRLGHVVSRGALRIEAPPKIRLPRQYEDGLLIEADEVVRLKVGLAGRPPPMVVWCHNGEIIRNEPDSAQYEVQTTEKNSTLRIANSQRSDRGEYNLRAINKLGDDVVSFLVTVTDRPSRPGRVTVTMTLGKSVTLAWLAPDDDGGCKIGNYVVEYYRIGWNVWLKAVTTRQLSATLSDLIEGSEYKFRVKAESPYGMSDPSDESEVMFVPDPKRGILTGSMAASRSADSFEIAEQVSRIPVLTKPPLKSALKSTATAEKSASLPRTKAANPNATAATNPNKRLPAPKVFDSETIAREMSYGSAGTPDADVSVQPKPIKPRQDLNQYDQQQLLKDMQYETGDDAFEQKQIRRDGAIAEAKAKPVKEEPLAKQLSSPKHDEPHTSSEFMLVLYDNQGNKKSNETDPPSYDPEFDSIAPPQLSHSTPELGNEHPVSPRMRRCVSSTEMLYEKAMQRFYKAVELEEDAAVKSQQSRANSQQRRSASIEPTKGAAAVQPPHDLPVITRRLGSFGEADLLERRNSLRKRVSTESLTLPAKLKDKKFVADEAGPVSVAAADNADTVSIVSEDRDLKREIRDAQRRLSEQQFENLTPTSSVEYEDDYTESTASSESIVSVDSMEKFKNVIRSISKEKSSEMDTYNPMMSSRTVSSSSNVRTIQTDAAADIATPSTSDTAAAGDSQYDATPPLDTFDSDEMIRRSLESTEPEELLSEEEMEETQSRPTSDTEATSRDRERALSPYRTPDPDQSTIALTRPLPLPSPDFVPKPILKRPSIEDMPKEKIIEPPKPKPKPKPQLKPKVPVKTDKPVKPAKPKISERKVGNLLQMFKKSTADKADPSASQPETDVAAAAAGGISMADSAMKKLSAAALARKKLTLERKQNSIEENKVAVDHYSEIMNTVVVANRRPRTPVYLSTDELKRQAERDAVAAAAADAAAASDASTSNLSQKSQSSTTPKLSPKPVLRSQRSIDTAKEAANLKESEAKRSLFATKLSKDPKKLAQEALQKKQAADAIPEFRRSFSRDEELPPSQLLQPVDSSATDATSKRSSLQRGRTSVSSVTSDTSGTRSRSGSVLRKTGSRDTSQTRATSREPTAAQPAAGARSGSRTRTPSKTRQQSQSKSPSGRRRTGLHVARIGIADDRRPSPDRSPQRSQTPEQLLDEAERTVRSTMAYVTDVSLLVVASWLYMFKNVWLVLPILALLVYRQVSAALVNKIPKWMKRKRSAGAGKTEAADADVEAAAEPDDD